MAHQGTCSKCVELWRNYGTATRDHVVLLKEQEAVAGTDPQRFRELDALCDLAAAHRDTARAAIKVHLATEHQEEAPKTMTA
jgi:hypothetical protein